MTPRAGDLAATLGAYHPVFIEGAGSQDDRDPAPIARQLVARLKAHWSRKPIRKPLLVLTQGDPREATGISAITPLVAAQLGVGRGLICLDEHHAAYHARDADREAVVLETRYSTLAEYLEAVRPGAVARLEAAIEEQIRLKNERRKALGKAALRAYFRDFALLQEVSKAACSDLCDGITMIHTSANVHPFSVTSFYTVGLALGLVSHDDRVAFEPPIHG